MSMLVLMLRFYLPLLRIDLRQQPDMLMMVNHHCIGDGILDVVDDVLIDV